MKSEIQNEELGKYHGAAFDKKKLGMNNSGFNKNNESAQNRVEIVNSTNIQVVPDEKSKVNKQNPTSKIKKMQSFPHNYPGNNYN